MFKVKADLLARATATLLRKAKDTGGSNKNYILLMALAGVLEHAHASVKQQKDAPLPQADAANETRASSAESTNQPIEVAVENAAVQQAIQKALAELAQMEPAIQELIDGQLNLVLVDPVTGKPCVGNDACVYAIGQDGSIIYYEDGQIQALSEQGNLLQYAQAETGVVPDAAAGGAEAGGATGAATAGATAASAAAISMPMVAALGVLGVAAAAAAGGGGGGGGSSTPSAPANSAPTAVALSASTVAENAAGAIIGDLTVTDPDAGNTHTLAVDDARFEVVSGQLKLKAGVSLDHETAATVNVTVTATDAGGLSKAQAFAITVTDVAETTTLVGTAGNDTINQTGGLDDFIITGLAGADTITTGSGNDIIRPGEGADTVNTGTGNDIVVVVGQTAAGQYAQSDITNPGGSGIDLSSVITLADLNGRVVSEVVAGESIDGGAGTNRLVIYGNVDLTGVTLANITQFQVNSTVTISAQQLSALGLTVISGDGESVLNITNSGAGPVTLDLSGMTFTNFRTLNVGSGVTVMLDQADVDSLQYLSGEGTLKASTATGTLNLASKYITLAIQDKDGNVDGTHGGGTYVAGKLLIGTESADTLTGGATADRLEGGAGNDSLIGGDGNDVLRGGAGVDSMDGGAGDDTFVVVGDLSGGGKVDSDADTAALGSRLTNFNGKNLNEDEDGAAEIIRGGDGDDTLYVYGTADLSNYDITGIEHVEIRSEVQFTKSFFEKNVVKTITGDGTSTLRIDSTTPIELNLADVAALKLSNIGQILLGSNVTLKISSLDQLGGARILTGEGKIEATAGTLNLTGFTKTSTMVVKNADGSPSTGAEVLDHVITAKIGGAINGTSGDDYLIGTEIAETLNSLGGNDLMSGKGGNDTFKISGSGTKTILDSSGTDTLDLSAAGSAANLNLTDGGAAGAATVNLGSGSGIQPLDLLILQDLSGSFDDDVATVRSLVDSLTTQIKDFQPNTWFGAASFVDKPTSPFGSTGDYVYKTNSKLSSDVTQVKAAFTAMVIKSGADGPEAQLEALYQVALRTLKDDATTRTDDGELDFRPGSARVVIEQFVGWQRGGLRA